MLAIHRDFFPILRYTQEKYKREFDVKTEVFSRPVSKHRKVVAELRPSFSVKEVFFRDYGTCAIYRPPIEITSPLPTVLYIAGNAFVASETGYTHNICSRIVGLTGYQVILLKHRLAPEFKAPIPFEDIKCTVNKLLLGLGNPFNIDKGRVAICGYSSGGNLAALLTIYAKKNHLPIAHQVLISPLTDLSQTLNGFERCENEDTAISQAFVDSFLKLYIPEKMAANNPTISPYWSDERDLQGLPPTDILLGEFDRFRKDAEKYAKRLMEEKNMVYLFKVKTGNHGSWWHNPGIIEVVAQRLRLSIGTESIPRSLSTFGNQAVNIIRVAADDKIPETSEEHFFHKKRNFS